MLHELPAPPRAPQWEARRDANGWYLADPKGDVACRFLTGDFEAEGNAKAISLAMNSYGPLVAALEKIAAEFCDADDCFASADALAAFARTRGDADAGVGA